jgi:hypothetical protein
VGHFQPGANPDGTVPFQASDGGIVSISTDVVEMPLIGPDSPPYEIIGQAMSPDNVAVRGSGCRSGGKPRMSAGHPRSFEVASMTCRHCGLEKDDCCPLSFRFRFLPHTVFSAVPSAVR